MTQPPTSQTAQTHETLALRAARYAALAPLFLSALLYPLRLLYPAYKPFERILGPYPFADAPAGAAAQKGALLRSLPGGDALLAMLRPLLHFQINPLTLKESITSLAMLLAASLWAIHQLSKPQENSIPSAKKRFPLQLTLSLAFLIWALASLLRAPHFGLDTNPLHNAYNLAVWSLFAYTLLQLLPSEKFEKRAINALLLIALILMLISLAQATSPFSEQIFKIMFRNEGAYNRNLYGSLIGHNTGVAVICLGPFFFLLGRLLTAQSKTRRALLFTAVLLALYFFAITKSRYVWVILPPLTFLFLLGLKRFTTYKAPWRSLLTAALILFTLFFAAFLIPTHSAKIEAEKRDVIARVKSFQPSILLRGTRLRILAVTAPLIAEKPLIGHGLASFPVLYPKAQADYFTKHPNSRLRPPLGMTYRAHNDYLQLTLETGLIGLGLALLAAIVFLRTGLRRFQRLKDPQQRLRRYCALFAIATIALHALIDFPFHLAPLATFFIFYCALFHNSPEPVLQTSAASVPPPSSPTSQFTFRPRKVARLTLALSIWGFAIASCFLMTNRLRSDYFAKLGSDYLADSHPSITPDPALQRKLINDAPQILDISLHYDPYQFEPHIQKGDALLTLAKLRYREFQDKYNARNKVGATIAFKEADDFNKRATLEFHKAASMARDDRPPNTTTQNPIDHIGPRLNHIILHYLGLTSLLNAQIAANLTFLKTRIRPSLDLADTIAYWEEAIRYSPANAYLIELILDPEILKLDDPDNKQKRLYYLKLLHRYNPEYAEGPYLAKIEKLTEDEKPELALELLQEILQTLPGAAPHPKIHNAIANAQLAMNNLDAYRDTLEILHAQSPQYPPLALLDLIDYVRAKNLDKAEEIIDTLREQGQAQNEIWRFAHAEILAAQGKTSQSQTLVQAIFQESTNPAETYIARATVRLTIFANPTGAIHDAQAAASYYPPAYTPPTCLALLRSQLQHNDTAALRRTLHALAPGIEKSQILRNLRKQILAKYPSLREPQAR